MRHQDIWWADLPKPAGRRPVISLSREGAYEFLNKVVAAEITSTIRNIPIEVPLGHLRTVPRQNLVERISQLPPRRIPEVKRAVGYALGWEELIEAGS